MSGDLHLADSGKEVPAKPAAWQPRWKTDSSIQPSSYNAPDAPSHTGRFASSPRHDHGHSESRRAYYRPSDLEHYLNCYAHSTFAVEKVSLLLSAASSDGLPEPASEAQIAQPRVVAIIRHEGANPKSTEKGIFELWTRHNFDAVLDVIQREELLPAYSQLGNHRHRFAFNGFFRLHKAEKMTGEPVLEFLAQRPDSQNAKDARVWQDKASATWLKVTAERVRKEEQKEDPITVAKRQLGLEVSRSGSSLPPESQVQVAESA